MRVLVVIILLFAAGASVTSCKKKPSVPPAVDTNHVSPIYINATINGAPFTTDTVKGFIVPYLHDSGIYNLTISASVQSGSTTSELFLYVTGYYGLGLYGINPPSVSATYYKNGIRHYANMGQIVIALDSSNLIQGTFNFTADSINVTNGTFSCGT